MNTSDPLPINAIDETGGASNLNEDPITHEHGSHPVSTGIGAAGGGAAGAAIGVAVGGPVGGLIGAVIGAFAGGAGGKSVGESIDPTQENESWPGQNANLFRDEKLVVVNPPVDTLTGALHEHGAELEQTDAGAERAVAASPSHEDIALRAWRYYVAAGERDGHALEDWLRAEAELKSEPSPYRSVA